MSGVSVHGASSRRDGPPGVAYPKGRGWLGTTIIARLPSSDHSYAQLIGRYGSPLADVDSRGYPKGAVGRSPAIAGGRDCAFSLRVAPASLVRCWLNGLPSLGTKSRSMISARRHQTAFRPFLRTSVT